MRKANDPSIESFNYHGIELENGKPCPHCGRFVELYRRSLQKQHAQVLMNLYNGGQDKFQHYTNFCPEGFADYGKLKYWKLIEQQPHDHDEPTKLESGSWKLTYKGIEFLFGRVGIRKHLYTFDDTVLEIQDGVLIYFTDLFGERFNIQETFTHPEPIGLFDVLISKERINKKS